MRQPRRTARFPANWKESPFNSRPIIRRWRRVRGGWSTSSAKSGSDSAGPDDGLEHSRGDAPDVEVGGRALGEHRKTAMTGDRNYDPTVALFVELRGLGHPLV